MNTANLKKQFIILHELQVKASIYKVLSIKKESNANFYRWNQNEINRISNFLNYLVSTYNEEEIYFINLFLEPLNKKII